MAIVDGTIYFETDAQKLFGNEPERQKECRDPYLQRLYKRELEEESMSFLKSTTPKCMLESLDHPVLIASHIKPYKVSDEKEEFDVNNGLLLSRNLDSLFDLGYITFNDDGTIKPSKVLSEDMKAYLSQYKLNAYFINSKRMQYMQYHREYVFEKRISIRRR
ncbi:HNH endonuclease signature motif containing protein [Prevotella sp. HUN102]|uniref:HNH endonuclease signature motif containing protein n=1 Tax=Prevotella sp. HUN102 TaxID=1392486 RepID=UPI00048D7107|nr:HNH endonuclease signature motif containing protein [Prevotella sp. HUN102]